MSSRRAQRRGICFIFSRTIETTADSSLRLYGVVSAAGMRMLEGAGVEGHRCESAMAHGRTFREFSRPATNVDEESSGQRLRSADRRFGYKLTSVGVHPGNAYLTTETPPCQAR